MKQGITILLLCSLTFVLTGCDKKTAKKEPTKIATSDEDLAQREKDIPLLPVKKGDSWVYAVRLNIPAGVNTQNPEEVNRQYELSRNYIGMYKPSPDQNEAQCFEVKAPDVPVVREFLEIKDDSIMMLGTSLDSDPPRTVWYANPVPYLVAGIKPGTAFPPIKTENESVVRNTDVIAREEITVPAGKYACIRMLTTGRQNGIEMRRTQWYAPQHGLIREETSHYVGEKLLYREEQELVRFTKGAGE